VVRDAIGPDIKLMCDINQRWRVEQAIDIGHRVADVGLFWLEDVTTCDDYAGLARINQALSTPIAGGEYLWGITPFRQMIEARSVDYVMIDLCRVGGVTQWMKVAGMAEAFNLPVVSHVMPEMHLHLVAAVPNGLTVEYMPWMLKLYEETPAIEKGQLVLPTTPGLGLKFDENDYQVKMRAMKSFIEEGDKVKVTLRFRGREMAHQEIGIRVLERIRTEMDTTSKVEQMPRMENRQMVMVLTPK
jgi:L-talarate/galactarate dehydratase